MTQLNSLGTTWRRPAQLLALIVIVYATALAGLSAADSKPDKDTASDKKPAKKSEKKTQYSGAELYAMHCNRCHPERYATERTASQWTTLLLHMRVRANIPAEQAKAILKFLQADSGK